MWGEVHAQLMPNKGTQDRVTRGAVLYRPNQERSLKSPDFGKTGSYFKSRNSVKLKKVHEGECLMKKQFILLLLITALIITGCGGAEEPESVEPVPPTLAPTETAVPEVVLTPTPAIPLALLVLPADMDQETSDAYQALVYNLAQSSGMRFQVRNTLTVEDLEPSLRVVIVLPPDPGLMTLAPAAPQAQFLSVNIPDMVAGGNLSVVADTNRPDIVAFISGYISAMITEDYRVGAMLTSDAQGEMDKIAYTNGKEYYCGTCEAFIYPAWCRTAPCYPQFIQVPVDEDPITYNAYSDFLIIQREVETMFADSLFTTPELLTYLSSNGILLIGEASPTKKYGNWVVTIQPDPFQAIESAWPQLVAGVGGITVAAPLILTDINAEHLDAGKQANAEVVLEQLQTGQILTGVNP